MNYKIELLPAFVEYVQNIRGYIFPWQARLIQNISDLKTRDIIFNPELLDMNDFKPRFIVVHSGTVLAICQTEKTAHDIGCAIANNQYIVVEEPMRFEMVRKKHRLSWRD